MRWCCRHTWSMENLIKTIEALWPGIPVTTWQLSWIIWNIKKPDYRDYNKTMRSFYTDAMWLQILRELNTQQIGYSLPKQAFNPLCDVNRRKANWDFHLKPKSSLGKEPEKWAWLTKIEQCRRNDVYEIIAYKTRKTSSDTVLKARLRSIDLKPKLID